MRFRVTSVKYTSRAPAIPDNVNSCTYQPPHDVEVGRSASEHPMEATPRSALTLKVPNSSSTAVTWGVARLWRYD